MKLYKNGFQTSRMSLRRLFLISLFFCYSLFSCNHKKLIKKEIKTADVTIRWYKESYISNIRTFIEVSKNKTTDIAINCNNLLVTDISIENKMITVKMYKPENNIIYSFKPFIAGYTIKIDSSASENEYNKVYQPEYYKPDKK
jgi:hypothetical protein